MKNVDCSKTKDNLILANESIEHAYERLFGEATEVYNARQVSKGRPDRQIESYYAHVRDAYCADRAKVGHSKSRSGRPAPAVEYVVQLGNRETWSRELDEDEAKAVYSETFERIKARTAGAIDWFAAAVHVDETDGTPHMHIIGIPYGQSPKRGLPVQVSMNKALKTMGLDRLPDLQDAMMGCLEDAARDHGVERAVMDDHHRHMDVPQFKRAMRELDEINGRKEASRREVSDLAKLADVTRGLVRDARAEERATRALEEEARAGLENLKRKSPLSEIGLISRIRLSSSLKNAGTVGTLLNASTDSRKRSRKASERQKEARSRLQTLKTEQTELQSRSLSLESELRDLKRREADLSSRSSALDAASRTLPGK